MTEVEIGRGIKNGREQVFALFYHKYQPILLAYMTTYTGSRSLAEELVQQAFIILWEKRLLLAVNRSPKHYLFSIAKNLYKKQRVQLRKHDSFIEELRLLFLDKASDDQTLLEKRVNKLKEIIENLPPKCREVLIMNKYEGLKYQQIAELKDISVKTVESQMRIAYTKIREGFSNYNSEIPLRQKKIHTKKVNPERVIDNPENLIPKAIMVALLITLSTIVESNTSNSQHRTQTKTPSSYKGSEAIVS